MNRKCFLDMNYMLRLSILTIVAASDIFAECEGTPYNHPRLLTHRRSLSHERIRRANTPLVSFHHPSKPNSSRQDITCPVLMLITNSTVNTHLHELKQYDGG